jgi:hypothetical protein
VPFAEAVDLVLRHDSRFRRASQGLVYIDDFERLRRGESLVWAVDRLLTVLEWVGGLFLVIFEADPQDGGFCPVRCSLRAPQFWMKLTLGLEKPGTYLKG